ncbi:MAG: hypothetical protein ACR2LF_12855 [Jatrophihabitantaceae bacterium]
MTRGVLQLPSPMGLSAGAPVSGVHLGTGQRGQVTLRLFRGRPTRVAVVGATAAAVLLAVRAAAAGASVVVSSERGAAWSSALAHAVDARVVEQRSAPSAAGGPTLLVDDRPGEARGLGEAGAWQCRVDLRSPGTRADLASLTAADVVLLGHIPAELADYVPALFVVPPAQLTSLGGGTVALVRRGSLEHVSLDPSASEAGLLFGS